MEVKKIKSRYFGGVKERNEECFETADTTKLYSLVESWSLTLENRNQKKFKKKMPQGLIMINGETIIGIVHKSSINAALILAEWRSDAAVRVTPSGREAEVLARQLEKIDFVIIF